MARVEDVSQEQMLLLATIFRQPVFEPYTTYAQRVYCIEPQLDRNALRPDFLRRLVQLPQSYYTPLCGLHKILDARLVHQIFVLIATEVGVRLNSLVVAGRDQIGHETWDCSILNLRSLHGAWLHPEVFWDTFGRTLDVPKHGFSNEDYMVKWVREEDKCEACILARIGGDLDTVFDLQMVTKSRAHTRPGHRHRGPRLIRLIEAWIQLWEYHLGTEALQAKLEWNSLRADRLKNVRKKISREKRHVRMSGKAGQTRDSTSTADGRRHRATSDRNATRGPNPESVPPRPTIAPHLSTDFSMKAATPESAAFDDDDDEAEIRKTVHDAENEIIDCYAALISTPFLPGMNGQEHGKRSSVLSRYSVPVANQVDERPWPMIGQADAQQRVARSQSTTQKRPSNYSESIYSQNPGVEPSPYTPPRQHWNARDSVKRSQTVQDKMRSGRSWMTASIAPSTVASLAGAADGKVTAKTRWPDHKFDAIAEETSSVRTNSNRFVSHPVSPLREDFSTMKFTHSASNSDGEISPVSPISPISPVSLGPYDKSASTNRASNQKSSSQSKGDESGGLRGGRRPSAPKNTSRLSKPFDGPGDFREGRRPSAPKNTSRLSKPFDGPMMTEPQSSQRRDAKQRRRDGIISDATQFSGTREAERLRTATTSASKSSRPKESKHH